MPFSKEKFDQIKRATWIRFGIDKLPPSKRGSAVLYQSFAYGSSESDGDLHIEIDEHKKEFPKIKMTNLFDYKHNEE